MFIRSRSRVWTSLSVVVVEVVRAAVLAHSEPAKSTLGGGKWGRVERIAGRVKEEGGEGGEGKTRGGKGGTENDNIR